MAAIFEKQCNLSLSREIESYLIKVRRDLHKIPELGFEEIKSLAYIKTEIIELINNSSLDFSFEEKKGGLVVRLKIDSSLKTFLFRADVDGLPIKEETNLAYKSTHEGNMHACGHDMHATMLLGSLKLIAEKKVTPSINITFIWQRSEETRVNGISGAEMLVSEAILENIDAVFGLHVSPTNETGMIYSKPGDLLSNTAQIHFGIQCSGGHVMNPHLGSNVIDILTEIQCLSKGFLDRLLDPNEKAILVPSIIHAGTVSNIRPGYGTCVFSFRNFLKEEKVKNFKEQFYQSVLSIVSRYEDAHIKEYEYIDGFPALHNNEACYKHVKDKLKERFSSVHGRSCFAGEDFAYYSQKKPACFCWLGAKGDCCSDLHSSYFNPDENCLIYGVAYWLDLAL